MRQQRDSREAQLETQTRLFCAIYGRCKGGHFECIHRRAEWGNSAQFHILEDLLLCVCFLMMLIMCFQMNLLVVLVCIILSSIINTMVSLKLSASLHKLTHSETNYLRCSISVFSSFILFVEYTKRPNLLLFWKTRHSYLHTLLDLLPPFRID